MEKVFSWCCRAEPRKDKMESESVAAEGGRRKYELERLRGTIFSDLAFPLIAPTPHTARIDHEKIRSSEFQAKHWLLERDLILFMIATNQRLF